MQAECIIFLYPNSKWKHWENSSSYFTDFQENQILISWRSWAFISQHDVCANVLFFLPSSPMPASPCSTSQKTPSSRTRAKEGGGERELQWKAPLDYILQSNNCRFCSRPAHFPSGWRLFRPAEKGCYCAPHRCIERLLKRTPNEHKA